MVYHQMESVGGRCEEQGFQNTDGARLRWLFRQQVFCTRNTMQSLSFQNVIPLGSSLDMDLEPAIIFHRIFITFSETVAFFRLSRRVPLQLPFRVHLQSGMKGLLVETGRQEPAEMSRNLFSESVDSLPIRRKNHHGNRPNQLTSASLFEVTVEAVFTSVVVP